jgi:SAM-dependent methyltransferase
MPARPRTLWLAVCGAVLASLLAAATAWGSGRDDCVRDYEPHSGQSGKDVVWVPTNDALVHRMLTMAAVTPRDLVYDLGAGDGKIAIAAAKDFGAHAVGVEYNPDMAKLAQCFVRADGLEDRVKIVQGDIFETNFSNATVVTLYLLPELNLRLRPTLLEMKPGTRVVSHSFLMDDWEPDDRSMSDDGYAYLWIVPARVEGVWQFERKGGGNRFAMHLEQMFQQVGGTVGERKQGFTETRLVGPRIELAYTENGAPTRLVGQVNGDRIDAQITRDGKTADYVGKRL